ncbi:glycosyltransferase [Serratia marcescens]|uniref:glycosyltransferase n=1 Tax=Serratia marcescens TaxID=615 RepID=UPI0039ECF28F
MPTKMKILHAAETIKGGVATVMRQLVVDQLEPSKKNIIVCLIPGDQRQEIAAIDEKHLVKYKRKGRGVYSFLSFLFSFTKTILKLKPEIVHLHSTFSGFLGRVALVFLKPVCNPKVVYCPHAFSFLMQSSNRRIKIYIFIEKVLSRFTDSIICVSEYERNKAIEAGLPPNKLRVVYNGVSTQEIKEKPINPYNIDNINMLFVGRFDYQKGFDTLVKVMHLVKGQAFHLTAVGGTVHDEAFDTEIIPQTTFTGWLNTESLAPYFIHADVLVMPSRWEGFGMVPLEAMSYGLPVLATNCTSLPELVVNDRTGFLFEMEDAQEIVEYLKNTSREKWKLMGVEAKTYFESNFTANKMIVKTSEIYNEILNNNR